MEGAVDQSVGIDKKDSFHLLYKGLVSGEFQVFVCFEGSDSSSGGAVEEPNHHEEGFVNIFYCSFVFVQGRA